MKKKITILSQGCRLNHAETASIINEFSDKGYYEVDLTEQPDIVVINTCTVTENGDKDTIRLINKINKQSETAKIALIGCQSQVKKDALLKLKNVEWVIGNDRKLDTVALIDSNNTGTHVERIQKKTFFQEFSSFDPRHTRVNLKIQDGCDFYCSFCIIPFARGPARSRDFNNIISDASSLISLGVKELILTGINLGTYKNNDKDFYNVLDELLKLNKNTRIRISSIEPTTIDNKLIEFWKDSANLCNYLHIPIQSGTDKILKKMRRKYTMEEYDSYIQNVKKEIPEICIGTDVIVGFPGESNEDFNKTLAYLKKAPINYLHVFSYSERTMAHSRKFEEQVDKSIIKKRSQLLRELSEKKWKEFCSKQINTIQNVLFESKKDEYWVGTTEHFIKVYCKSNQHLKNKMLSVNLNTNYKKGLMGTLSEN